MTERGDGTNRADAEPPPAEEPQAEGPAPAPSQPAQTGAAPGAADDEPFVPSRGGCRTELPAGPALICTARSGRAAAPRAVAARPAAGADVPRGQSDKRSDDRSPGRVTAGRVRWAGRAGPDTVMRWTTRDG
jgi:hypothetical protein